MKEVLIMILEKVKSDALSVEEGVMLIEALVEKQSKEKKSHKNGGIKEKWENFESQMDEKVRDIFSKVNINSVVLDEIGEKISNKVKKNLKDLFEKEDKEKEDKKDK